MAWRMGKKILLSSLAQIYYSTFHLTRAIAERSTKDLELKSRGLLTSALRKKLSQNIEGPQNIPPDPDFDGTWESTLC